MINLSTSLALLALVVLSGCGKDGGSNQSINQNLTGKIAGEPWTLTFGTARQNPFTQKWMFSLFNTPDGGDPCSATYLAGKPLQFVSFGVKDLAISDYDFSVKSGVAVSLTKATGKAGDFTASTYGAFGNGRVTKIEKDQIDGQLDVKANDSNFVKGTFSAKICR